MPPVAHTNKTAKELFGDDDAPASTRDRLIEAALNLFYAYGFHAVGLERIISAVGVTKTTFYNHFESKDELMVAAIQRRSAWEARSLARMVRDRAGFEPRAMLLAIFDVLDEWFTQPDYLGCLYINACAEFPLAQDPIHQVAAGHYQQARQMLCEIAEAVGVDDAQTLADQWVLLIQGAFTQRLVTGNDQAATVARRVAQRLLAEHLEQPSSDTALS